MKISIIGSGGWGTALAVLLTKNGHSVTLWSFEEKEYEHLKNERENRAFLPGVLFPDELVCTNDISVAKDAEIVVMAVPSFAVRATAKKLSQYISDEHIVVNVAKGIEKDTSKRLSLQDKAHLALRHTLLSG